MMGHDPQTLQWWTFETSPVSALIEYTGEQYNSPLGLTGQSADLPEVVAQRLLRIVAEDFDNARCESNGCGISSGRNRRIYTNGVGFHLAGDADEITEWAWTTIILLPDGRVVVTCEDCSPDSMYTFPPEQSGR